MDILMETERAVLRNWHEEDLQHFARMNGDPVIMEYLPRVLTPEESDKLIKRFQGHINKHGYGMYAVARKSDDAFMGTVGLNAVDFKAPFTPATEIAWRLDYEFWGQGYASEIAARVLEYGFHEAGLKEIVSFTVHDNQRSIGVMEKLGMQYDEKGDFDYPKLPKGHPLGRFVLYRLQKNAFDS